jgi:Holliday junction DNA helicase RuvB
LIERPNSLKEFIGQEKVKKVLEVAVESAKKRGKPLDHALFYGPPGTGKTTLSMLLAKELGKEIKVVAAPNIERKGDLIGLLTSLKEGDLLFIDEIHRLPKALEEVLYSAMEDFRVDVVVGGKRAVSLEIPPFTLLGATTKLNLVSAPLRSRFGMIYRLELYSLKELKEIARRGSEKLGLKLTERALELLSICSRGTPRVLNQMLKRILDFKVVKNWNIVEEEHVKEVLVHLGIDEYGLDPLDRKILYTVATVFKGGPVGLKTLSAVLKEEPETVETVHEPYLVEQGFLVRTPRGRKITEKGLKVLGLTFQPFLF